MYFTNVHFQNEDQNKENIYEPRNTRKKVSWKLSNQVSYQPADLFNFAPAYVSRATDAYFILEFARTLQESISIRHRVDITFSLFSPLILSISQDNSNLSRRLCAILAVRFARWLFFSLSDITRFAMLNHKTVMKNVIYGI